jgi:hypothetical protein
MFFQLLPLPPLCRTSWHGTTTGVMINRKDQFMCTTIRDIGAATMLAVAPAVEADLSGS